LRVWTFLVIGLGLVWASAAAAADAETQFRAELQKGLGHGMPGISAAIATRQGVIWTGAVGYANLESHARANEAYLYGIGSITKTFVACVVQELADEGRLDLDRTPADVVGHDVVRGIPNADRATLRQLLAHTSGIPTWEFDADWIRRGRGSQLLTDRYWRKDETLDYIRDGRHAATNEPGMGYAYSNSNYTILGLVIEKVTGHDALVEIRERVLRPLSLSEIKMEGFEPIDPMRVPARYHFNTPEFRRDAGLHPSFRPVSASLIDVSSSNLSTEWTAGGLMATARNLAEFTRALRDGEIVGEAAMQRMLTFTPADEPGEEAGQGLFRETLENGSLIGYDGGVLGFGGVMGWVEGEDLVIVILTNVGTMHSGDEAYFPLKLVKTASFVSAARRLARELSPPHAPVRGAPPQSELRHP
jgi:D-alanyl-D-alanine carboxypeptidase